MFGGIRAPSTLGTFLRGFTWGMCVNSTPLLPGADSYAFLDVDSTINRVYGYAKQGADYGYTRVRGLHPLLATISTRSPLRSSPVPACVGAGAGSAKGAASFVAEAITTARQAAPPASCWPAWTRRSTATPWWPPACGPGPFLDHHETDPTGTGRVRAAIAAIETNAWVPIAYPHAIQDEDSGQWISDAQIAETTYTAYPSRRKSERITVGVDRPAGERQKCCSRPRRVVHRLARVERTAVVSVQPSQRTVPPDSAV